MKIPLYTFLFLFCATGPLFAQQATVKGRVVETNSGEALPNVTVQILNSPFKTETTATGTFNITGSRLPQGEQVIAVSKQGYMAKRIPVVVQNGSTVNLEPLLMEVDLTEVEKQIGIISLSENQLNDDNGTSFNISGLLQASNDVFFNAAAFDFSATFFRPRGLDNANGKVLINGIEMNKQFNGRPQWSNWGGLNDAMRNRDFTMGTKANDYLFGDLAGTTNITMRASQYRKGGRVSYASSNRSYRGRVIGSYNSGQSASGWAYSVLLSRRFGDEGYQEGTLYDANAFFASVEKKLNSAHSLNLTAFYTPNRRGRATAITQEVKDLKGTRYNPNWGLLNGEMRNTNVREVKEPVFMLNHYWELSDKTKLNTNVAFQTGKTGSTRIDNGGTRLLNFGGQESYVGGARNPFPNYYQRLPSFFLQDAYPTPSDFQNAYAAAQEFRANGQFDWHALYLANSIVRESGGNSIYAVQEDRSDDTQISANTIFTSNISDNITLNGSINYRNLKSENFAELKDLLGGTGYLDVDFFAEDDVNIIVGDIAQSDLRNRNRIVAQGDRYKYNYELNANVASAFGQAQFKYNTIDFFVGGMFSQAHYQRNGLYENGNFPGARSFGPSEKLKFSNFGVKAGATYKISGRHLIDVNAAYFTKAPNLRNSFSNARQNNDAVIGLTEETVTGLGASYIFRSPIVKARLTGFYNTIKDGTDLGFYFTENISGLGIAQDAFIQEVLTGVATRRAGAEMGIEAQLTPTVKLKAAASVGQYVYTNNPKLYITSEDFDGPVTFGDGTTNLKDYHVAGGPERAAQLGFEYRDPAFWWVGFTGNYFSDAYIDVNNLARSQNFTSDFDGQPFNDYDPATARGLLAQEKFDDYVLVNIVGGKSWRIKNHFVGFFATINNVLGQEYRTGGFEQGRNTNFRDLREDKNRANGPVFGPRYFYGYGTTYYLNVYVRF